MAHGEFGRRVGALNALIDMFEVEVSGRTVRVGSEGLAGVRGELVPNG